MYDIIGLDMGTYNFKSNKEFICRSVYSTNTKYNVRNGGILELNGERYQMGVGKFDAEIIKADRDNLPLFLYALAMSTDKEDVKIVVGMPNYQLEEDVHVNKMKNKFIGEFNFSLNGEKRKLNVLDMKIFPEGMGAYYTITNDLSDKDVVLIDIGGSTFNVLLFKNNEFIKADTLPFGSLNLLNDIRSHVMGLHGGRHTIDDIGNYMKRGRVGKSDDKMEYVVDLAQKYIDELMTLLTLEYSAGSVDYFISGGGVEVFSGAIIKNIGDVGLIKDYVFANANGFKMIGDVIYGE